MPKPKRNETKKEYMGRCMSYPDMQKYPADQRYAICLSMWKKHHKKAEDGTILSIPGEAEWKIFEYTEYILVSMSYPRGGFESHRMFYKLEDYPEEIMAKVSRDLVTKEYMILSLLFHKKFGWTKESVEEWVNIEL
jgi:hypothetical protein